MRAVRTARRLGMSCGVVYAPEDAGQDWIGAVDWAVPLQRRADAPTASPYLDGVQIVAIARQYGFDAIWPAWGFLAERAEFAQAVLDAGICWVGPPPAAIRAMGSKTDSSAWAQRAGVPTIPELVVTAGPDASRQAIEFAAQVGFPLLLKPALGGGGQGQQIVRQASEFETAYAAVQRINAAQFQNGPILLQRYLEHAHHIEAQVLADAQGTVLVLHERDCSMQRRYQKIIEESPSPALTPTQRAQLMQYARQLTEAIHYVSAGTLEFLFADGQFYFLEMNTRLQVEHPVTERTTRIVLPDGTWREIDLLAEMLQIATGQPLAFTQAAIRQDGHAIEARIYAEDPTRDFHPAPGAITSLRWPLHADVRVDAALLGPQGVVDPRYDPMLGKLIAWGAHRPAAIQQLERALVATAITGIPTNLSFLHAALQSTDFREGRYTTHFVAQHPALLAGTQAHRGPAIAAAAVLAYERDRERAMATMMSGRVTNVAAVLAAVPANGREFHCEFGQRPLHLSVHEVAPQQFQVTIAEQTFVVTQMRRDAETIVLGFAAGAMRPASYAWDGDHLSVTCGGEATHFHWQHRARPTTRDPHAAPSGGRIVRMAVQPGQTVSAGDVLYVMEAMKMESQVLAVTDGAVSAIHARAGDAVETGTSVVSVTARALPTTSATVSWTAEELSLPTDQWTAAPQELIQRYLQGYDVPQALVATAVTAWTATWSQGPMVAIAAATWLAERLHAARRVALLFTDEHVHAVVYFTEHVGSPERQIPKRTEQLIGEALADYGIDQLKETPSLRRAIIHLYQAMRNDAPARLAVLHQLATAAAEHQCRSPLLSQALIAWLQSTPIRRQRERYGAWRALLARLDGMALHAIEAPVVAPEYRTRYEQCCADPLASLPEALCAAMRKALAGSPSVADPFQAAPSACQDLLRTSFPQARGGVLPVSAEAAACGVQLFVIHRDREHRVVAFAHVATIQPVVVDGEITALPTVEQTTIELFAMLRAYRALGLKTGPNHAIFWLPDHLVLPWETSVAAHARPALTPQVVLTVGQRIGGFSRDIELASTEVIGHFGANGRAVMELSYVQEVGLVSRPPHPCAERKPLWGDPEAAADLRQRRLGKLLNRDRARLLFDQGTYEELIFPGEAEAKRPVGLNVYRGMIQGHTALAYAGDFRHRGGALGEAEGKKLAACVVLAYALQVPLFGIHDGAGADISGSVASLGWAGAYFGAIAATGGHATHADFTAWFGGHCEREYFTSVLKHFAVAFDPIMPAHPLIHMHLHLGAAVGMLVYGPSISHCAFMVDHPAVYRLLTGAGIVERVTGEKSTNYGIGGAPVHGRLSGEVDFVLGSEEAVIAQARQLLACLAHRTTTPAAGEIHRSHEYPQPTIPVQAGIVVGRDAIRANVDGGAFWETRRELTRTGGLMTGFARLAGQPVLLAATATDYGLHHGRGHKKVQLAAAAAQEFGIPLCMIVGANWDRLSPVVRTEVLYHQQEMRRAIQQARVPKINLVLGPRSIERSIHHAVDLLCYVCRGNETDYERQRAHLYCHYVAESLAAGMDWCADLLRYLPRPWELPPAGLGCVTTRRLPTTDRVDRSVPELADLLPRELTKAYEMRAVIQCVVDQGSFREFAAGDQQPLITGVATLDGHVIGIIADAPAIEGGAQTVVSIAKFTRFQRFCARFGLPLIELNDSPAFRPGREQEQSGIQAEGGKSIREEVLSGIPKLSITLRQNYGGRYIHANLVTLGPVRRGLVMHGARLGVMGAEGAVDILGAKELAAIADVTARAQRRAELVRAYEATKLDPQQAVALGYADRVIAPQELRVAAIQVFQMWIERIS